MLISKSWLADFVQLNVSTEVICEKLTSLGLEVESAVSAAPAFTGVVVGKVTAIEAHPDADKLRVTTVDVGAEEPLQIVCGAANVAVDMLVPVATVGAVLPGNFKIKKSKLRGVPSHGMLCSESEIGLAESADGLMPLPADFTIGQDIREALLLDDEIIEIGLTPNRGDCLSVEGVARELSVAFDTDMLAQEGIELVGEGDAPAVALEAAEACPYYSARVISGVDNTQQSPLWLTERLRRSGIRSLSPVVDITNYVMLALGTPLHAFAKQAINGDISVRMAAKDEAFTLLDGKDVSLSDDMLVIADSDKAIALAGIMGGENSAVTEQTTEIVLESAWFSPDAIAGRARRLGLHTDASHRFERGVDFAKQERAMAMATQMIIELCGGQAGTVGVTSAVEHLPVRAPVSLQAQHIDAVLGVTFPRDMIAPLLTKLGMAVEQNGDEFTVTPPSYRFDVAIAEDLIEELARIWGYENIPLVPIAANKIDHQPKQDLTPRRQLHAMLVGLGYNEAISYSFVDEKTADMLSDTTDQVTLLNSLSAELSVMRTSLLPSLAKALSHNVNRQQSNVRLYEFGSSYKRVDGVLQECELLAGISTGSRQPLQWGYRDRARDFFDVKGEVESIFDRLGVLGEISYKRSEREYLHPGQSAEILFNGENIGFIGGLHPSIEKIMNFDAKVFAFEIDIVKITRPEITMAESISKYPEIRRDISVLLAQGHQSADIMAAIKAVDNTLVTEVCLFDVYIGRNIPRNTKSMAIAVYLQDKGKTLTDEQADSTIEKITAVLIKEFNAELRG